MGAAPCKNPKSSEETQKKEDSKKITIGVFGLDNAGKTSTVKAIEGAPTRNTSPTMSSETSKVPYPTTGKGDNKSQERITIIDVSGSKKFRERSWSEYYNQIHGLIFVIDASEKRRMRENKDILEDLLSDRELQNKPILILANKQDRRDAINEEDDIKEKLQIETLKRKHKIELCTAIPSSSNNNKADESIRQGFSWLIRTIESNYTELNARVIQEKNSRSSRPIDKKPPVKPRHKNDKSDDSDNDGIVYTKNRTGSPPLNRKTTDFRSSSPPLNRKTTDYRSTITSTKLPSIDLSKSKGKPSGNETYDESDDENERNRSRSRPNIGRFDYDNHDRDYSLNQINSTSTNGFNKKKKVIGAAANQNNNNTSIKKPSSDEPKSFRSSYEPFPEDTPWSSSRTTKTTKPDDIITRSFAKPLLTNDPIKRMSPLVHDIKPYGSGSLLKRDNLSDDDDDLYGKQKTKSTPLLTNKPLSTYKKPTIGSYGINDDDDYLKKGASKTTKSYDSDEDNKNKTFQRPSDRFNLNSEYRGTASKPPSSPSMATTRSKHDDDDFPSSSLSKPLNRTKFTKDDYSSSLTKPTIISRFNNDDDDDRPSSQSKPPLYSRYGDNDNNRPLSSAKTTTYSKYNDDDYKSPIRSKFDNDDRPSSAIKSTTRSKYDDDDDDFGSASKPVARSNYYDNKHSTSPLKPLSNSKFEDDDDFGSVSKPAARSNYYDNKRTASPSKPTSYSKYDDDDDNFGSSSKTTTRSKYDDDDYDSSLKPVARSKYTSNDTKSNSRSKYDDDDDDDYRSTSPVKPASRSKYDDDDDDYTSSSKKNNYSSRDDDYNRAGSTRIASASTNRYRSNS